MLKKCLAIVIVSIMVISNIVGCAEKTDGGKKKGKQTEIQVVLLTQLGTNWFDAIVEKFEEKYPEYKIAYVGVDSTTAMKATYGLEDTDVYDLYVGTKIADVTYMEPLNDILETTVKGESKTIGEKFNPAYLAMEEYNGNYYMLTCGGGHYGFMYNKNLFQQAGIEELPRTTNELAMTCDMLADENIIPLCHFNSDGYYKYINEVWWAQYDGVEAWKDFYNNPTKEKMTTQDGRYEVLKVHEQINTPDNVWLGSNSASGRAAGEQFWDGKCAITVGSGSFNERFGVMKTPVISSIIDKLTSVKTERVLRDLITAIDAVTEGTESEDTYKEGDHYLVNGKSVDATDWNRVKEARNMLPISYGGHSVFVPTYSDEKEGAKKFITFLYSDEGYQTYLDVTGSPLPLTLSNGGIDSSQWDVTRKENAARLEQAEALVSYITMAKHEIFLAGGADPFCNYLMVANMSAQSEQSRKNAREVWDIITTQIEEKYEKSWMASVK